MFSKHAIENMAKFTKFVPMDKLAELSDKLQNNKHQLSVPGGVAIVVELDVPVNNPERDQWELSDAVALVVRGGTVVSVMLTRKEQCHLNHFRTALMV